MINPRSSLLTVAFICVLGSGIRAELETKESVLNNEPEPTRINNRPDVVAPIEDAAQEAGQVARTKPNDETPIRVKRYGYGMDGSYGGYGMGGYGMGGYGMRGYGMGGYGSPYEGGGRTVIIKKIIIRGGGGYGPPPFYG